MAVDLVQWNWYPFSLNLVDNLRDSEKSEDDNLRSLNKPFFR